MDSHFTPQFRALFRQLPTEVRHSARKSYRLWKTDPFANSLHFKEINHGKQLWSVRAALGWRALGVRQESNVIVWVWIGPHAEYDALIQARRLKKR